jgi:hypothetical protein
MSALGNNSLRARNNKQPRYIWRCEYSRWKLGGRCAPKNVFHAATAAFSSSGIHWMRSVLAWRAFPLAGVLQNAKVLACVQGGPCNRGLDPQPPRGFALRLRRQGGPIEIRGAGGERATGTCFCIARAAKFFACARPPPQKKRKRDRQKTQRRRFIPHWLPVSTVGRGPAGALPPPARPPRLVLGATTSAGDDPHRGRGLETSSR